MRVKFDTYTVDVRYRPLQVHRELCLKQKCHQQNVHKMKLHKQQLRKCIVTGATDHDQTMRCKSVETRRGSDVFIFPDSGTPDSDKMYLIGSKSRKPPHPDVPKPSTHPQTHQKGGRGWLS